VVRIVLGTGQFREPTPQIFTEAADLPRICDQRGSSFPVPRRFYAPVVPGEQRFISLQCGPYPINR